MTHTKQAQYKILFGVVVCQIAFLYAILTFTAALWLSAFFIYFLMFGLGVSLLNHRMLSHRSVVIDNVFLTHFLLFWSTVMLQGSTLAWVGMHREHHAYSDTERDPHSPKHSGFWASYWLSMMHTPNIRFVKDLLRNRRIQFYHKHYWAINAIYAVALFALFGIIGVIVAHLVPAALAWHGVSIVNAVSHIPANLPGILGYRNFDTTDYSKNIFLAGYLTFGEAWHNNHHSNPTSITFSSKWWEWDLVGQIGILLNKAHN